MNQHLLFNSATKNFHIKKIIACFIFSFVSVSVPQTSLKWHNIIPFEPRSISADPYRSNLLWLTGTGGLFKYNLENGSWESFNTAEGLSKIWATSHYIEEDKIWVGTEAGGANLFNLQTKKFTPFLQNCTEGPYLDYCTSTLSVYPEENNLWVGTDEEGLYLIDKISLDTLQHFTMNDGLGGNCIYFILDDNQYLWLATAFCGAYTDLPPPFGGISRLNKSTYEIRNYKFTEFNENYYSLALIDDTLWAAGSMGLFTFNRTSGIFAKVFEDQISGAEYISADKDNIWVIGDSSIDKKIFKIGKASRLVEKSLQVAAFSLAFPSGSDSLFFTAGDYDRKYLYKMDKVSFNYELIPDKFLPSQYCYSADNDNNFIYTASGSNIVKISKDDFSYSVQDKPGETIRDITVDEDYVWVCTNNGLFRYENNDSLDFQRQYFLSERVFFAVSKDNDLWVSTQPGLYRINKSNNQSASKDFTNDLETFGSPVIKDLVFDSETIWLSFTGREQGGQIITGIIEMDKNNLSVIRFVKFPISDYSQEIKNLIDMGDYFLASGKEISKINKTDLSVETFIDYQADKIKLKDSLLWAVAGFKGVKVFDINTKEEKLYLSEKNGLLHNQVTDYFIDEKTAVFSTYGGISILELSSLPGITGISEKNTLNTFELYDNYPNPFNPITNFRFSISSAGGGFQFVTLKIYDLLGREAATLVNEEKHAGTYTVKFDGRSAAGGLASGVYFYQLKAGNNIKTKKFILLK